MVFRSQDELPYWPQLPAIPQGLQKWPVDAPGTPQCPTPLPVMSVKLQPMGIEAHWSESCSFSRYAARRMCELQGSPEPGMPAATVMSLIWPRQLACSASKIPLSGVRMCCFGWQPMAPSSADKNGLYSEGEGVRQTGNLMWTQ